MFVAPAYVLVQVLASRRRRLVVRGWCSPPRLLFGATFGGYAGARDRPPTPIAHGARQRRARARRALLAAALARAAGRAATSRLGHVTDGAGDVADRHRAGLPRRAAWRQRGTDRDEPRAGRRCRHVVGAVVGRRRRRHRRRACTRSPRCRPPPNRARSSSTRPRIADAALSTALRGARRGGRRSTPSASPTSARRRSCGTAPTGEPVGPGLGWQDLRTVVDCLILQGEGVRVAPNVSATKVGWLLNQFDPDRTRDLCFGTVDSWIAWTLSGGARPRHRRVERGGHRPGRLERGDGWDHEGARRDPHPAAMMPTIVDTAGVSRHCDGALPGHAADRVAGRRPAGVARRPKLRAARRRQDHVRHRRHARRRHRPTHARRRRTVRTPAASRSSRGATAARRCGASKAPCCRPAPASSGCATTSQLITHGRGVRRARRIGARHRRRVLRARVPRPRHTTVGLRRPRRVVRPHARHDRAPMSCAPCSKASPIAAPTWSKRPRADFGRTDRRHPRRRRHVGQRHVRAGAGRRLRPPDRGVARARSHDARRRLPRARRHRRDRLDRTNSSRAGRRRTSSTRPAATPTAPAGPKPCPAPQRTIPELSSVEF